VFIRALKALVPGVCSYNKGIKVFTLLKISLNFSFPVSYKRCKKSLALAGCLKDSLLVLLSESSSFIFSFYANYMSGILSITLIISLSRDTLLLLLLLSVLKAEFPVNFIASINRFKDTLKLNNFNVLKVKALSNYISNKPRLVNSVIGLLPLKEIDNKGIKGIKKKGFY
jgi:hypothetical protein